MRNKIKLEKLKKVILFAKSKGEMKKSSFYIFIVLTFFAKIAFSQQDPQISQFMFNKLFYNPAYAGNESEVCFNALGHQQWRKFEGAPNTNFLTADMPLNIKGNDFGLGVIFLNDQYGFVTDFAFYLPLAYRFNLGMGRMSIGLQPGIFNKTFKPSWKFPEQNENILTSDRPATVFDINAGAFFEYENFSLGLSATHLTRPAFRFAPGDSTTAGGNIFLTNHFFFYASYDYQTSNYLFDIIPNILVKSDISSTQFDINISVLYNKKVWAGVSYRNKDSFVFLIGTSYFKNIKLGLSYDLILSSIGRVATGTFEAYIGYCFSIEKADNARQYRNVKTL